MAESYSADASAILQPVSRERHYFPGLDSVRFFAALLVAIYHLGFWATIPGSAPNRTLNSTVDFTAIADFAWAGRVGVEIFFVLSGFVIAGSAHRTPAWAFFRNRVLRLYPAAWLCASITLVVLLINDQGPFLALLPRYLNSLSLFPSAPGQGWIDGVYWTLQIEIIFYAVVFITRPVQRFVTLVHLAYFFTAVSGLYILLSVARYAHFYTSPLLAVIEPQTHLMLVFQFRYGCLFALGIWFWVASSGAMNRLRGVGLVVALLGAAGEVFLRSNDFINSHPNNAGRSPLLPLALWGGSTMLMALITCIRSTSTLSPLSINALRAVGLMTYPFYLLHNLVGAWIMQVALRLALNQWVALICALTLVCFLSFMICRHAEPILRRVLSRLIPSAPPSTG